MRRPTHAKTATPQQSPPPTQPPCQEFWSQRANWTSTCASKTICFYPAVSAASELVAIVHAEHRQVSDQLATFLRTAPAAPEYEGEWRAFVTTLDAHAAEEERDLIPPPGPISDDALEALGNQMLARMDQLHESTTERLRAKARGTVLRAL